MENETKPQFWYRLSVAICAVLVVTFLGLMSVVIVAPDNRALHNIVGGIFIAWCLLSLPAAFYLMAHARSNWRRVEAAVGEMPFRPRPNRAYFAFAGSVCFGWVLFLMPQGFRRPQAFFEIEFWFLISLMMCCAALMFWLGTGWRVTLLPDRIAHFYCFFSRGELLYSQINAINVFFQFERKQRGSFLQLNGSKRHRIALAPHSSETVVRMLQLLNEATPHAFWTENACRWRDGEVNG